MQLVALQQGEGLFFSWTPDGLLVELSRHKVSEGEGDGYLMMQCVVFP